MCINVQCRLSEESPLCQDLRSKLSGFGKKKKHLLQNLNQNSAFRLNLNFKILTKPTFRILTKVKLYEPQPSISSKILTKLQLQEIA